MNFPLFVSRRYLFSKKSTHAINLISVIAVLGVAVATMAMVVVMSSFNGFADLIASLFTEFDPQLKVQPVSGKAAPADDAALVKVKQLPFVAVATECVEDQALAVYRDRQMMVTVKGVEANFDSLTNIRNILYGDGEFRLSQPTPTTPCLASGLPKTSAQVPIGPTISTSMRHNGRDSTT